MELVASTYPSVAALTPSTVNPLTLVCVAPRLIAVDPSVNEAFASAVFGIALAATVKLGVLVELVTVGTSQLGQLALGALKLVTVPAPLPLPQAEPVFVMNPELSICKQLCPLDAASPGSLIDVVPENPAISAGELPPE
jgi:hypothetical protein